MLAGKPILITAKPEYSEFVKDSGCGFYADPENLDEIVSKVMKVYNMPKNEREEMGKRGKDYILKFYSEQSLGDKLEEVINQTLSEVTNC